MSEAKKSKRKPQITARYRNENGNHLHVATDMGFGDPYWAKLKSQAIIEAALCIEPRSWIVVKIEYAEETAFTKFLERVFKKRSTPAEYLVVRTKSLNNGGINSWFFIHNLELGVVVSKLERYSDVKLEAIGLESLKERLESLFDAGLHPDKPRLRRWDASRNTKYRLRLFRMQHLIRMARKGEDHMLTEGLPTEVEFETRLAKYIKHNKPLIHNLRLLGVFWLLVELEKEGLITRDETIRVLLKLLEYHKEWELTGLYKGLPKHGAKLDREDGRFDVREGKHSVLSILLEALHKQQQEWETFDVPEVEPGEEYLE